VDRLEVGLWQLEQRGKRCAEALRKNGFDARFLPDKDAVREHVLAACDDAESIGFGGSMSVAELGLPEALAEKGKRLLDHGRVPDDEKAATRLAQLTCDLFLSGTNAVTLNGCLVNMDGNGNRVNAMTFGPKKVVVVAGANKIVADVEEGIRRIKTTAAPRNAKRLKLSTPCATSGFCEDCNSPQRICRVYSIMVRKPRITDISVLICGEPMGY
jgi:LUD domain